MFKQTTKNTTAIHLVLIIGFLMLISCGNQKNYLTKIDGSKISITKSTSQATEFDDFIKPYRNRIDADLNEVLAYNPESLEKSDGKWQSKIGTLLSDICLQKGNVVFESRENKKIDLCLLNYGGIRSTLPKGAITAKNAYQIMPFENSLYVVALKTAQILELCNYIIAENKAHPLSGLTFTINKDKQAVNIMVQNKPLELNKIYYVATNDYLMNGGDDMTFFKTNTGAYDLNYKIRNVLIDYLKEVDTIRIDKKITILQE